MGGGGGGGSFTSDNLSKATDRINQLQSGICGSWITGPSAKFCSTHGWGLGPDHDSMSCREGEPGGHVNTATQANPVGPRKNKKKLG